MTNYRSLVIVLVAAIATGQASGTTAVRHRGNTVITELTQMMHGPDARAASNALSVLGPQAVPALTRCAHGGSWLERYWTACALGQIGSGDARAPLEQLLKDHDPRVQLSALLATCNAFGASGVPGWADSTYSKIGTGPALRQALAVVRGNSEDDKIVRSAVRAIEGTSSRVDYSITRGGEPTELFHESVMAGKAYVHVYGKFVGGLMDHFKVITTYKHTSFEQDIALSGKWRIDDGDYLGSHHLLSWPHCGDAAFIVIAHLPSGSSNTNAPAAYLLRNRVWRPLNPVLRPFSSDDYGEFFVHASRLYTLNGNNDGRNSGSPQTYRLTCYHLEGGRLSRLFAKNTERKYDPHSKEDPLNEFGIRR